MNALLQAASDDDNRGRVTALNTCIGASAVLLTTILASALADRVGVVILFDAAALAFIAGGLIALTAPARMPVPSLR